ncbi:TPA: helix-turn-helix transcriptional regulator [Streptococcus pyogenes]|uniref:Helix-turn-helix transcriptional regulator n=1 Tax=Streptococcus pyogenes TaxID=1314 RepID=A0A660A655_STRPY|nr:helix-turn-helix transcriptional regulator [Streptococcus pyogenes]EPZ48759.1 DNA-binding helix-turn-helix protein [Streptococcus pyogenes GA40634]HER4522491.1 helix-turn-helix transcriptional regulator [Streptococcus pyogenes NGAS760]HER4525948.1 helix-turn-helix transcriptional regulator [Streptococcus pyogenes NGAS758]HER4529269.1 helix-turn-helix transcriptional regulator [Streptococcus pyogenes NGAS746]HER4530958.1 helix-turn-helix transcriptional regulator [Streptococcus pyogenes NGAS
MEIGQQMIRYRKQQTLSQEELVEKVYVSRQSISNWENDKTYPDIHSLLLLSQIFQVSLDQLIKGDIEKMKYTITQVDKKNFERDTKVMVTLMILLMISSYPLVYFLEWLGLGIFVLLSIITMTYANRVERFKKKYDVQPYKEILAVSNGKLLDEIEKREERAKLPYQKPLIVTVFFLITVVIVFASRFMFTWLFH